MYFLSILTWPAYAVQAFLHFSVLLVRSHRSCSIIGKEALSASRRLIESFSLSHTKDAPCTFNSCYRCSDIHVYIRAQWFKCNLDYFTLPRFEYAITCITSLRFSAFLPAPSCRRSLTPIRFASNKFIMALPKFPRKKLIRSDRGLGWVASDHGKLSVDTPFNTPVTFLINFIWRLFISISNHTFVYLMQIGMPRSLY